MVTYDINQPNEVNFHKYYHQLLLDQHSYLEPFIDFYRDCFVFHCQLHLLQLLPHFAFELPQSQKQKVLFRDFVVDHDGEYVLAAEFEPKTQRIAHFLVD